MRLREDALRERVEFLLAAPLRDVGHVRLDARAVRGHLRGAREGRGTRRGTVRRGRGEGGETRERRRGDTGATGAARTVAERACDAHLVALDITRVVTDAVLSAVGTARALILARARARGADWRSTSRA
jgi:hypothetical protein